MKPATPPSSTTENAIIEQLDEINYVLRLHDKTGEQAKTAIKTFQDAKIERQLPRHLIIDFEGVPDDTASGWAMYLLDHNTALRRQGESMVLARLSEETLQMLKKTRVDCVFAIETTVENAMKAPGGRGSWEYH